MNVQSQRRWVDRFHFQSWVDFWSRVGEKSSTDDLFTLSAAVSFYLALSLSPFLLMLLAALSLLRVDLQDDLILQVGSLVGENASQAIAAIIQSMRGTEGAVSVVGLVSLVTLLVGSSAVFGQLKFSVDLIIRDPNQVHAAPEESSSYKSLVWDVTKRKLLAMGMVLAFILISIVSLVASSVIGFLISRFQMGSAVLVEIMNNLVSIAVFGSFFSGVFKFVPRRLVGWKAAIRAGVSTAVLFILGKFLIGLYLSSGAISTSYGAAGSFLALLVWVYYSAMIIFFGAEVANELQNRQEARA